MYLLTKLRNKIESRVTGAQKEIVCHESTRMARTIQQSLLPNTEIDIPHIVTASHCQTAGSIGGDYYTYILLDENRISVLVAGVVGHDLHSAMLGAMAKSWQPQIVFDPSTSSIMKAMNHIVEKSVRDPQTRDFQLLNMYMSCCYILSSTLKMKNSSSLMQGTLQCYYIVRSQRKLLNLNHNALLWDCYLSAINLEYNGKEARWQRNDVLVL